MTAEDRSEIDQLQEIRAEMGEDVEPEVRLGFSQAPLRQVVGDNRSQLGDCRHAIVTICVYSRGTNSGGGHSAHCTRPSRHELLLQERRCVMANINIGLERSRKNKWIFGVCGGIAEKLDINPLWVRVGALVLAVIVPGVSVWPVIVLYVLMGLFLPQSSITKIR